MKKNSMLNTICYVILFSAFISSKLFAQSLINRDSVLTAAFEIIKETNYCALVTVDSTGQPQVRTMNPFPANTELITWFATSRNSRKVKEMMMNPKVSVYYANHNSAKGYATITGTAQIIDDKELLVKMKRDYWENIPNWQNHFVLIKIVPKTLEVINYKHGLYNDPKTGKAASIVF